MEQPRRKPVPGLGSSYASQGHYEMNPINASLTPDNYHYQDQYQQQYQQNQQQYQYQDQQQHSFDPSGYASSQNSQHGILPTPSPYEGVAGDKSQQHITVQEVSEHQNSNQRPWNSPWLTIGSLLSFAVFFAVFLVALVAIYTVSERSDGFEAATQSTRYAWKYMPTAIIVVISALWNRLDYICRLLSPWQNLKKGPVSLDKSLLLDYISPMGPVIIIKSIKNRDWAVAVTGIGALLLKVAAILSTGLFSLRLTAIVAENVPMVSIATFGASTYNSSLLSLNAGYAFYGVQVYNLSLPDWTTNTVAIQPFEPIEGSLFPKNSTLSSEVLTFRPSFECEVGETVDLKTSGTSSQDGRFNVTVVTPSCKFTIESSAVDSTQASNLKSAGNLPLNYVSFQSRETFTCEDGSQRVILAVSKADKALVVNEISAIMCRPSYGIQLSSVTTSRAAAGTDGAYQTKPIENTPSNLLNELNFTTLYDAVLASTVLRQVDQAPRISEDINFMFQVMGPLVGKGPDNSTLGQFLNTTFMIENAQRWFTGTASQLARQEFMDAVNSTRTGTALYQQNKLWANKFPVFVLSVVFALLALSVVLLQFLKAWDVVPRCPDTIFSTIAMLSSSSDLKRSLDSTGFSRISDIQTQLRQRSFRSRASAGPGDGAVFCIDELPNNEPGPEVKPRSKKPSLKSWRPFIVSLPAIIGLAAIPLGLIVVLEVIQQKSDRLQGFLDVENRSANIYGMAFLPAVIVTVVALSEGSLASNAAIIAAFWRLKARNASARSTILFNTVGDLFPVAVLKSVKNRYWGLAFVNIAAVLASFLTVFTANLYAIEGVTRSSATNLNRLDGFNLTHTFRLGVSDEGAGVLTSIILNANLSYPAWTYDNLVFPAMALPSGFNSSSSGDGTITARVPTLRPVLNCTVSLNQNTAFKVDGTYTKTYNISGDYPQTCPGGDGSLRSFQIRPELYTSPSGYFSSFKDINTINDEPDFFSIMDNGPSKVGYPDRDIGCPSLSAYFGHQKVSTDNKTVDADVTVLVCTQLIQQLDTDVTFLNTGLEFDTKQPPVPIESTATYVKQEFADSIIHQYQLRYGVLSFGTFEDLDYFYNVAVNGMNGTPASELLGAKNADRLANVTSHLYGQYMAQAISVNMRNSSSSILSASPPIKNAVIYQQTFRIFQNRTPKLILQILLGIIAVCNILTWGFTGKTKNLLYHSPTSIVGTASLIAGSELWSPNFLPRGIEYRRVGEERMFDGWLFSLGWWGEGGEKTSVPSKRFGIDVGKAD